MPFEISLAFSRNVAITGAPVCADAPAPRTNTISLTVLENGTKSGAAQSYLTGSAHICSSDRYPLKSSQIVPLILAVGLAFWQNVARADTKHAKQDSILQHSKAHAVPTPTTS